MSEKTKNLKLIKPNSGATNWGAAINGNMETLDEEYSKISSRINIINQELGEMNYIYFNDTQNYVKLSLTTGNLNQFIAGTVNEEGIFSDKQTYTTDTYGTISDFTAFYVYNDYPQNGGVIPDNAIPPYNTSWLAGDILVKKSIISGQQRVVQFMKFPQALGGYYVPIIEGNDPTTVTYTKTLSINAPDKKVISFPPDQVFGKWKTVGLSSKYLVSGTNSTYKIPLEIKNVLAGILPPPVDFRFFYNTGTKLQRFEVDYWLTYNGGEFYLNIEFGNTLTEEDYGKITISYIQYIEPSGE